MTQTFYQDYSTITDPDLRAGIEFIARLNPENIQSMITAPAVEILESQKVSAILLQHQWATAKRAICYRTTRDDPNVWRNAVPPDPVPIVWDFATADANSTGFKFEASPAAGFLHSMDIRYFGFSLDFNAPLFVNTVTRRHKTDETNLTVGHELVIVGAEKLISCYVGNDGKSSELPPEFREVRVMKNLRTAYREVVVDVDQATGRLGSFEANRGNHDYMENLQTLLRHQLNYRNHLQALQP